MADGIKVKKASSRFPTTVQAITTTQVITAPAGVGSVDLFLVGGGGGRGGYYGYYSEVSGGYRDGDFHGGGGGSGYIYQLLGYSIEPGQQLSIEIGSAGSNGSNGYYWHDSSGTEKEAPTAGTSGGTTKVSFNGTVIASASGGGGGARSYITGSPIYSSAPTSTGGAGASGGGGGYTYYYQENSSGTETANWGTSAGPGGENGASGYSASGYNWHSSSVPAITNNAGGSGRGTTTRVFGTGVLTASGQNGGGTLRTDVPAPTSTGYGDGGTKGAVFVLWHRA